MAKPKFDKRTFMAVRGMSRERMFAYLYEVYRMGYEDGKNDTEGKSIHFMALKRGVKYECGCCGAELILDDSEETDGEEEA